MLFICAFAFVLFACKGKTQDEFKNLSSDDFERLIEMKRSSALMYEPLPNTARAILPEASTSMHSTRVFLPMPMNC